MLSTSSISIENVTSHFGWVEGAFIVIKESLNNFPSDNYSRIADFVKKYFERNHKTPEDLFDYLNNKSSRSSIDYILLGFSLEHGVGTIPNSKKAFLEFQKAANSEFSFGQFFLGRCYDHGIGTHPDRGKAFEFYSKAAEMGNTLAQNTLGWFYLNGLETAKNVEKAFKLYSKAAELGDTMGQNNLGWCYQNGWGATKNPEKAFELYSKAAEAGNILAQNSLGWCYQNGLGTTKNLEKAFEFYSKAAEAGNILAQNSLGWCYQNGLGTTKNLEKAFELYSKAAEVGNTNAQNNLGWCYQNGLGTTKNVAKAFEFYSKAVEGGSLIAQINLEHCYHGGNPCSKNNLETCYRNRWGTMEDLEKSFKLYSKTTEAGNPSTQYNLGWCYQNGWGTTKNLAKAYELYLKAEGNKLSYQSDFPDLNGHNLTLKNQDNLERFILQFQSRGFKGQGNPKGEFLDSEAFFDQLSDEFKCYKCGNLGVIISGSPICPFCDTNKSDDIFEAGLPKCPECYSTLKDPLWCKFCEYSRFSKSWGIWSSGNDNIDQYIAKTQEISESCRGCLEWISPDEITFLEKVGMGGFGIVKKGRLERGKILFWDEKNQKHERSGVTKVALKFLRSSQNIKYINSDEFIAHLKSASCKYILECYGITKDVTTDEFIMVLPFAEHGDLKAFLRMNENPLTWKMVLCILFQIVGGLRFIHESELVHGDLHPGNILVLKSNPLKVVIADLGFCRPANYSPQSGEIYGVVQYLAPEVFTLSCHTKYSDIYSFAIISWEIISGERPWNDIKDSMHDVISGKRPTIEKHTPQCIQEMIQKNWRKDLDCRDTAEQLQQRIIAARGKCNLNESISKKRSVACDMISYKSRLILGSQSMSKPIYDLEYPNSSSYLFNYSSSNKVYFDSSKCEVKCLLINDAGTVDNMLEKTN
ncbi:hypothetical protein G9A89_008105 [Geosiphon pyriformis]|nr:hypothetical protein G9A89_008105 [Geosiphon pyriformis]